MNIDRDGIRYRVQKTIGKGTYTQVDLAIDTLTNKLIVLKSLYPDKFPGEKHKIAQEVTHHRMVKGEHIVEVLDTFSIGNVLYMTLEYLPKGDLYTHLWIEKHPSTEMTLRRLFYEVCIGVREVHRAGLIHRDIKPENIFLSDSLVAKLGDFGWSCRQDDHTSTSEGAGTLAYMSPECLQETPQTTATDIWSLGVLLYELYHSKEAFTGDTVEERIRSVHAGKPAFDHSFSQEAAHLYNLCVQIDPACRPSIERVLAHPLFNPFNPNSKKRAQKDNELRNTALKKTGYTPLLRPISMMGSKRKSMDHYKASIPTKNIDLIGLQQENHVRLRELQNKGIVIRQRMTDRSAKQVRPISMGKNRRPNNRNILNTTVEGKQSAFVEPDQSPPLSSQYQHIYQPSMNDIYLSSQSQMKSYMQGPIQDNSPGPQTKPTTTSDLLRLRLHLNFTDPNSKTLHDSFENLNTNKSSTLYAPIMKSHREKSDTSNGSSGRHNPVAFCKAVTQKYLHPEMKDSFFRVEKQFKLSSVRAENSQFNNIFGPAEDDKQYFRPSTDMTASGGPTPRQTLPEEPQLPTQHLAFLPAPRPGPPPPSPVKVIPMTSPYPPHVNQGELPKKLCLKAKIAPLFTPAPPHLQF